MQKRKLLITDGLAPDAVKILEDSGLFEIDLHKGLTKEELIKRIGDYEAIVIRSATKLTADVLEKATNIKAIMRAGSGVDNIDLPSASSKGIYVFNTPGSNNNAVAELTVGYIFALLRQIPFATMSMKKNQWEKKNLIGFEAQGKTLGLVGLGAIGCIVAEKAHALGMRVIAFDPAIREPKAGVETLGENVDYVFSHSDIVSLHLPLMDATKNSIGRHQFDLMKEGAYIIHCARGGIVNEEDLLVALNSGKLAGAALDVFDEEPVPENHPLVMHKNVISSPHVGAATKESQQRVGTAAAKGLIDFFRDHVFTNAVNFESVRQ